jgi:hypothetical protein
MVKPLMAFIPDAFQLDIGQRARLLLEPVIGSIIPDVLVGVWSGELPRCAGLNSVSRHILAWLSVQKIVDTEQALREHLFLSQHATANAVASLKRVGAIIKRDSGEVEIRPEFDISCSVRLIAIELKLKRWREALEQAIVYRKFTDEAHVVLDGNQIRMNAQIRAAFLDSGVGLLLQRSGNLTREIEAHSIVPEPSVDRLVALTKLATGPYCLA